MKLRFKSWFLQNKYYFLIIATVILFFYPIFKGQIPFPGDLLADENPYNVNSYFGIAPGGFPNKAQGPDVIKEIYPWRFFSIQSLKKGQIPFWNPYNFSGNPQMADFQTALFYPLNILYIALPFNIAWTLLIMLQPLLAGIFMFLFLSKGLNLSKFSSFIGGLAFAVSSYMTVWIEYGNINHTILWLPLALLFTKRLFEKISRFNFFVLVLSLTFSILAGYIQELFYIYVFSFIYFFYLSFGSKKLSLKKTIFFFSGVILPILISSFQILPTLQLFSLSTRGAYSLHQIGNILLPFQHLLTAFAPDFFGNPATRNYYLSGTYIERVIYAGIPILFFAFYSLFLKFKEKKFFLLLTFSSLLFVTNLPFVKYLYLLPIPVISTTVPTRELIIFIFCLIILASFGINFWEKENKKSKYFSFFILIYILIFAGSFVAYKLNLLTSENFRVTERNLVLPFIFATLILFLFYFKNKKVSKVGIAILLLFDLFYFFNKITPFSSSELIYPKTAVMSYIQKNAGINRSWGYGSAYIPANFQTVDRTFSPEGNDALHIVSYGELLASSVNGSLPEVLPRPDANIAPGYGQEDLKNNFYRKRVLDLLGVKYILYKSDHLDLDTFPKNLYNMIWTDNVWQIYENKNSYPRFFTANNFIVSNNKAEVLKNIYSRDIDLKNTLLLNENPSLPIEKNSKAQISLLSYKPNDIKFKIKSTGNTLFFLSDNYYPEWRARIDGKDTKILVADYTFRAVTFPKGDHVLELNYLPEAFLLGFRISLLGLLLTGSSLVFIRKYEKK